MSEGTRDVWRRPRYEWSGSGNVFSDVAPRHSQSVPSHSGRWPSRTSKVCGMILSEQGLGSTPFMGIVRAQKDSPNAGAVKRIWDGGVRVFCPATRWRVRGAGAQLIASATAFGLAVSLASDPREGGQQ